MRSWCKYPDAEVISPLIIVPLFARPERRGGLCHDQLSIDWMNERWSRLLLIFPIWRLLSFCLARQMLCELHVWGNFFTTWASLTFLGALSLLASSGTLFWIYYINPTYEQYLPPFRCYPTRLGSNRLVDGATKSTPNTHHQRR